MNQLNIAVPVNHPLAANPALQESRAHPELLRLARQYSGFAGTPHNALSLIAGLRSGNAVTLDNEGETLHFNPPATRMGWEHVQKILSLAREGLSSIGIERPNPAQIVTALMGGTLSIGMAMVQLPGVLRLYCAGAAWSRIAKSFVIPFPRLS